MGLGLFSGSDDWDFGNNELPKTTFPNPDPKNFKIKKIEVIGDFTWVLVNYPNCPTFKGDKILIFKGDASRRIKLYNELDPHFSETGLTPIARFRPDSYGVTMSKEFCDLCSEGK